MKNLTQLKTELAARRSKKAFSLIELLVVIAVIGIIAAIAIPNIGNLTSAAQDGTDQRNAQNIVSVFSAARAAGDLTTYPDVDAAVAAVVTGITSPSGVLFQVPGLNADQQDAAIAAGGPLTLSGAGSASQLIYTAPTAVSN